MIIVASLCVVSMMVNENMRNDYSTTNIGLICILSTAPAISFVTLNSQSIGLPRWLKG